MKTSTVAVLLSTAALAAAHPTTLGCFKRPASFKTPTYEDSYISYGLCANECKGAPVYALSGIGCYCADKLPAGLERVDEAKCNVPCAGFSKEKCGGEGVVTLIADGHQFEIPEELLPEKEEKDEDGHDDDHEHSASVTATTASGSSTAASTTTSASVTATTTSAETSATPSGEAEEGQDGEEEGGDGDSAAGRNGVAVGAVVAAVVAMMV